MAHWLTVLPAFAEDGSSIPKTQMGGLQIDRRWNCDG